MDGGDLRGIYGATVQHRKDLDAQVKRAITEDDHELAEKLRGELELVSRAAWALMHRVDARTMHGRGHVVVCAPKTVEESESWMAPDRDGIIRDLQRVAEYHRERGSDGPLRSTEAALEYLIRG